jgi:hypothetical protein
MGCGVLRSEAWKLEPQLTPEAHQAKLRAYNIVVPARSVPQRKAHPDKIHIPREISTSIPPSNTMAVLADSMFLARRNRSVELHIPSMS